MFGRSWPTSTKHWPTTTNHGRTLPEFGLIWPKSVKIWPTSPTACRNWADFRLRRKSSTTFGQFFPQLRSSPGSPVLISLCHSRPLKGRNHHAAWAVPALGVWQRHKTSSWHASTSDAPLAIAPIMTARNAQTTPHATVKLARSEDGCMCLWYICLWTHTQAHMPAVSADEPAERCPRTESTPALPLRGTTPTGRPPLGSALRCCGVCAATACDTLVRRRCRQGHAMAGAACRTCNGLHC